MVARGTRLYAERLRASEALERHLREAFGESIVRAAVVPGQRWLVLASPGLAAARIAAHVRSSGLKLPGRVISASCDVGEILRIVLPAEILSIEVDGGVAAIGMPADQMGRAIGRRDGSLFAASRLAAVRRIDLKPVPAVE